MEIDKRRDAIIDQYLNSIADLGFEQELPDDACDICDESVGRIVDGILSECTPNSSDSDPQPSLFGHSLLDHGNDAQPRLSNFYDCVISSYLDVCGEFSIDRLIADRDKNCMFIQKCWENGVQASSKELNWSLMNARKAGMVGAVASVSRFSIPSDRMYKILFASDMAMRYVQDIHWRSFGFVPSVDYILCDPMLSDKFDEAALRVVSDCSSFEFRWSAISIRKNQGRRSDLRPPQFEDIGRACDVRVSSLSKQQGFYWFQDGKHPLYIGHASNLAAQIDRIFQTSGAQRVFPEWASPSVNGPIRLAVAPTSVSALSKRETVKSHLCMTYGPLFNVKPGISPDSPGTPNGSTRRSA